MELLLPFLFLFEVLDTLAILLLFYEFFLKNRFKHRVKDGIIADISYFKDGDYKGTISLNLTELASELLEVMSRKEEKKVDKNE
jgi:hypothetical protein